MMTNCKDLRNIQPLQGCRTFGPYYYPRVSPGAIRIEALRASGCKYEINLLNTNLNEVLTNPKYL
jgi:hypothetical protein